ncbi:MAG: ABC transporter substrate-binding protein [Roseiflexus sp.]|nr:ABC transporter substrate-binding protein [Roseiflexus sp.]MCS7290878.1 ABC transporter substrate-binding protein [Roseiflexus sp.]MDW8146295.1 ABC transporter substrate-binding protein [Roseiflexaceae bacterium]MDW8232742.1 ABC transporter substrate-binding protein [Roseiflexaceae bacterium]
MHRSVRRSMSRVFSAMTVLVFLLSACGAQPQASPPTSAPATPTTTTVPAELTVTQSPVAPTTPPTPASAMGSSLTVAISGDIDNFDPAYNQLILYEAVIRNTVFSPLVTLDKDMQIVPALATSWEQKDETTWIFNLRKGVTFHNGKPFSAEDVLHTFDRTIKQKMTFASKLEPIERTEVIDDHTLKITLKRPVATFLDDLYDVAITPSNVSDEELKRKPVGAGPFRFVSWTPNEAIVLERNPNYWEPGKPRLDRLTFRVLPDTTAAILNLLAGEIDAIYDVPVADAQAVKDNPNIVFHRPSASGSLFLIELGIANNPALQDVQVRRALAHTIDRATINQTVYFGEGQVTCTPLPAFSWAYVEQECPAYDLERARALLKAAGKSDLTFSIEVISGLKAMEDIATIWQASLRQIGVTLEINKSELNTWLDRYVNKNYDTIANWFNTSSDPNSMFDIIYKPLLASVYNNPKMNQLILDAAATSDRSARKAMYAELQRMTVDETAPLIVVMGQPMLALTSRKVTNWEMNGRNVILFQNVTVAP